MHAYFAVTLALITAASEIIANPVVRLKPERFCNNGPCQGFFSQCCSRNEILFCNGTGTLDFSTCDAGGTCVDGIDMTASCQTPDPCDSIADHCSEDKFAPACCADMKRLVFCHVDIVVWLSCPNSCIHSGSPAGDICST